MRISLAGLFSLLLCVAAKASAAASPDRWVEARSKHFTVLADSSVRDASNIASQFERMYVVFHSLLPTMEDEFEPPVMVLVLKDRKGLQALEPEEYLGKKQIDTAGFFLRAPDKNYILMRLDAHEEHTLAAIYHEYTHYIHRKVEGWLPLWLNEGLAQFYENTALDGKYVWLGQANAQKVRELRLNELLPVAALLGVDASSPYYHDKQKAAIFYAESWALTHYLIVRDRAEGTQRLRDYTQFVMQGEDRIIAAERAFGDLARLGEALNAYVMQPRLPYFAMESALPAKDASFRVTSVPTSQVDAVRADVLVYLKRTKAAKALLESVLRDDPGNEQAHESMGLLRYREGDIEGAKKWYGEAIGLDSRSYLAHYYYATMTSHDGGRGEDETIEKSLHTSIKLNPEFAPSYDALGIFYASRPGMLKEAHALSLRAIELAPDRLIYRLNFAKILAKQGEYVGAMDVLKAAMPLARTWVEMDSVERRMERVKQDSAALDNSLDSVRN